MPGSRGEALSKRGPRHRECNAWRHAVGYPRAQRGYNKPIPCPVRCRDLRCIDTGSRERCPERFGARGHGSPDDFLAHDAKNDGGRALRCQKNEYKTHTPKQKHRYNAKPYGIKASGKKQRETTTTLYVPLEDSDVDNACLWQTQKIIRLFLRSFAMARIQRDGAPVWVNNHEASLGIHARR